MNTRLGISRLIGLAAVSAALLASTLPVQGAGPARWPGQRPPLPPCPILDRFDQPDGPVGRDWSGREGVGGYQIIDQQLHPTSGGPITWRREIFGISQIACLTIVKVDPNGLHQSLLLKVQGNWRQGAVAVFVEPTLQRIGVETFVPGRGWDTPDYLIPVVPLREGDQLGVWAENSVDIFVNGAPAGEMRLDPFFHEKGGRLGLWFINANGAVLDNFGGATITP